VQVYVVLAWTASQGIQGNQSLGSCGLTTVLTWLHHRIDLASTTYLPMLKSPVR